QSRRTRTSQLTGRHAAVMAGPPHSRYYGTTDVASSLEEGCQRLPGSEPAFALVANKETAEGGSQMTATMTDYDEIVRVVQLYIDGFNDGDINKFKEAFHENAWIFFTDAEGALHKALLTD